MVNVINRGGKELKRDQKSIKIKSKIQYKSDVYGRGRGMQVDTQHNVF